VLFATTTLETTLLGVTVTSLIVLQLIEGTND